MNPANPPHEAGDLDPTFAEKGILDFSNAGTANAIASDKDGALIIVTAFNGHCGLSRYLINGAKDSTFQESTWSFEPDGLPTPIRVLLQPDGKILVIGDSFRQEMRRPAIARFNTDGSPDPTFASRVITTGPQSRQFDRYKFADGCLQKNGKKLVIATYSISPDFVNRLFCLDDSGEPDTHFGGGAGFIDIRFHGHNSIATDVQTQSDGSLIVAGSWFNGAHPRVRCAARYTEAGELDQRFGKSGYADIVVGAEQAEQVSPLAFITPDIVSRVLVQDDDKILIAGYAQHGNAQHSGLLARLESDGGIDHSFNQGKPLLITHPDASLSFRSMAIQPDGKIVAVGSLMLGSPLEGYERVSKHGVRESFWRSNAVGDCTDVTIQPEGRVVISGSAGGVSGTARFPRVWGRLGN